MYKTWMTKVLQRFKYDEPIETDNVVPDRSLMMKYLCILVLSVLITDTFERRQQQGTCGLTCFRELYYTKGQQSGAGKQDMKAGLNDKT